MHITNKAAIDPRKPLVEECLAKRIANNLLLMVLHQLPQKPAVKNVHILYISVDR